MVTESPTRIVKVNGRRRRPWALATKDNLLQAAIEEIARVGFAKARLVDIAKRADMTAGSVYTWFKNKEDLFQAALQHSLTEQLKKNADALVDVDISNSFLQQIAALVPRNHVDNKPTDAQQLLIECYYAAWREPKARKKLLAGIENHHKMYVDVFTQGQKDGYITKDVDAKVMATVLISMHTGLSMMTMAGVPRINDGDWPEVYRRLLAGFSA